MLLLFGVLATPNVWAVESVERFPIGPPSGQTVLMLEPKCNRSRWADDLCCRTYARRFLTEGFAMTTPRGPRAKSIDPAALDAVTISEVVEMALSDHVSFSQIREVHGLSPDQVKVLMRTHLKPGSYRAWRRRVREFGDRRAHYK